MANEAGKVELVEYPHRHACDVCGERSDPKFNMYDPRDKKNYWFCSMDCARQMDMAMKVAARLEGKPTKVAR